MSCKQSKVMSLFAASVATDNIKQSSACTFSFVHFVTLCTSIVCNSCQFEISFALHFDCDRSKYLFDCSRLRNIFIFFLHVKMSASKQKRLTLEQKVEILKKLESGVRANRLAIDFGVTEGAITYIKKKKQEIFDACANSFYEAKKKTLHKPEFEEMEQKLYKWFEEQRNKHVPINGVELKAMAQKLFAELYPDKKSTDFNASDGWFTKFKHRHGICGEILSSDASVVTPFIHSLRSKMGEMGINNSQLYNADETGLFYRLLPNTTYVKACEKTAPGRKIRKERISFMLCSNADGSHKVTPLVIGKSKNPRCFNGFKSPLVYDFSKNAWMTSRIFVDWFHNTFVKEISMQYIYAYK